MTSFTQRWPARAFAPWRRAWVAGVLGRAMSARKCRAAPSGQGRRRPSERAATKTSPQAETRTVVTDPIAAKGTWCSGITSASHAEGPGFKSQCVHFTPSAPPLGEEMLDPGRTRTCNLWFRRPTPYPLGHRAPGIVDAELRAGPGPAGVAPPRATRGVARLEIAARSKRILRRCAGANGHTGI